MANAETPPEEPLILVVDDEEMNRDMLSRRLERKGYRVVVAEDGFQALTLVEQRRFDLIVLDIMMPKLSGLEVLHTLRKEHDDIQLPILMASAKTQTEDIVSAFKLGANDYITKPIDLPIVLAVIERVLRQRDRHASARRDAKLAARALDAAADLTSLHAPDGRFLWASEAATRVLGYAPSALVGRSLFDLLHPDDRGAGAVADPAHPDEHLITARVQHADGQWVWAELRTRAQQDPDTHAVVEVVVSTRTLAPWVLGHPLPELARRARRA